MRTTLFCILLLFSLTSFAEKKEHTVKSGETPEIIANSYGISVEQLKKANSHVRFFDPGVILVIPQTNAKSQKSGRSANVGKAKYEAQNKNKVKGYSNTFEGMLMYRTDEFHNAATRKISNGTNYIGSRQINIYLKGNRIHIEDLSTHLHTVIIPEKEKVYLYSDLTEEGLEMPISVYAIYCHSLDINYKGTANVPISKVGSIEALDETLYCDEANSVYQATIKSNDNGLVRCVFSVDKDMRMPSAYRWFFYGYNPEAVVSKYLISFTSELPLFFGQAKSLVSGHLTNVVSREVDETEILPPNNIAFKICNDGNIWGFQKTNNKYLKKQKLSPPTIKEKEMRARINQEWTFSEKWLDTDVQSASVRELSKSAIKDLGDVFMNVVTDVSNLIEGDDGKEDDKDVMSEDRGIPESEEYYYIPDVIADLDAIINNQNGKIEENQQARIRKDNNARYKYERIGGQLIKVIDPEHTHIYQTGNFNDGVYANNAEYYTKIRNSFYTYSQRNKTDYISKERYNAIYEAHRNLEKSNKAADKKFRKEQSKQRANSIYQNYVSMLIRHSGGAHINGIDFDWIRGIQSKMKELREKHGLKQSPWEKWDGIHDP